MLSEFKSSHHHSQLLNPSTTNSSQYFYSDQPYTANSNMNGNYNSSLQQQQQQAVNATATQQQFPNQTYASYYMYNQLPIQAAATGSQQQQPQQQQQSQQQQQQQPQQPQQQPQQQYQQQQQQQSQTANPVSDQAYGAYRYQNGYAAGSTANVAAPQNYSLYQQTIPNQLSQPQPQHYNQLSSSNTTANVYGSAASSVPPANSVSATANNQSTPIPDTLNPTSTSTVGQFQPPDIRPRVTTTMWEDEKTLCYQVDANNVSVVRRADNNMINGTKLLNVAQMTRGRRDGILKSEKVRHVVKIGSMHLKGVWIPFERALAMAQREGIVDLLYPLFVRDIKRVIQTGATPSNNAGNSVAANSVVPNSNGTAATAGGHAVTKANSTPTSNSVPTNVNNFYQQYGQQQQYAQYSNQLNGSAAAAPANPATATAVVGATKSPQQAATATAATAGATDNYQQQLQFQQAAIAQQQQQQVYGYQQPYYGATNATASAPNQYYSYNYSAYGSQQPVYSAYGYQQLPPQSHPQQIQQHQLQPQQQPQQQQSQIQQSQVPIPTHGGQSVAQSSTNSSDPSISSAPTTVTTGEDIAVVKKDDK
ncbi:hypothetical protein DFJ63DRAFT_312712 [Scheffersomyces coipomensis]|uniref:uncharacterized protein n=1 Tax=Scheffersomyces coipomensis TaxID=1788519 RepID=UPI00315C7B35